MLIENNTIYTELHEITLNDFSCEKEYYVDDIQKDRISLSFYLYATDKLCQLVDKCRTGRGKLPLASEDGSDGWYNFYLSVESNIPTDSMSLDYSIWCEVCSGFSIDDGKLYQIILLQPLKNKIIPFIEAHIGKTLKEIIVEEIVEHSSQRIDAALSAIQYGEKGQSYESDRETYNIYTFRREAYNDKRR